jgi:hypothetical protein
MKHEIAEATPIKFCCPVCQDEAFERHLAGMVDGNWVWLAEKVGSDFNTVEAVYADEISSAVWLKTQHKKETLDCARLNAYAIMAREEQLAQLDSGAWQVDNPELVREHLTDPKWNPPWTVGEIRWEGNISRFSYHLGDECRIRRVQVITTTQLDKSEESIQFRLDILGKRVDGMTEVLDMMIDDQMAQAIERLEKQIPPENKDE